VVNGIPISDCFIKWFWAGFVAIAASSYIVNMNNILINYIKTFDKGIGKYIYLP